MTVSNVSDVSDELSLQRTSAVLWSGVERSLEVWGVLCSCGWIGGGVKGKGRLSQLLCVVLSV